MSIQTSIDGYRLIAERSKRYAPGPEPKYTFEKNGYLVSVTAYVMKLTQDGTWHTVAATAFHDEYIQPSSPMWKKMPKQMLAKCAEALAIKKCFPADLAGIYTDDEMGQADNPVMSLNKPAPIEIPALEVKKPSSADAKMLKAIMEQVCKVEPEFCKVEVENLKAKNYASYQDMPMEEFNDLLQRARDKQPAVEVE